MAQYAEGDKVKTSRYPGTWTFVKGDEHLSYIEASGRGTVMVATSTLSLHIQEEKTLSGQEILSAPQLLELSVKSVRRLVPFTQPDKAAQMEDLGFTEERLYRDILAEYILHAWETGVDVVRLVGEAMQVIGREVNDQDLHDAGREIAP